MPSSSERTYGPDPIEVFGAELPTESAFRGIDIKFIQPVPGNDFKFYGPKQWSDTALNIVWSRYARKAGVPENFSVAESSSNALVHGFQPAKIGDTRAETRAEKSVFEIVHRLAGCWTYWGIRYEYMKGPKAERFYFDCCQSLIQQLWAPNSPQWFNAGLAWAYGIVGTEGGSHHYHHFTEAHDDPFETPSVLEEPYPLRTIRSHDEYTRPQVHACYIQSLEDTLCGPDGLMDLAVKEARLFKLGSGSGVNVSEVRARDEPLSSGGKSSGVMSFLDIHDAVAGSIKSGGTTRRAAKMVVLDADHPDIKKFVRWKATEETKIAAMSSGGHRLQKWASEFTDTREYIQQGLDLGLSEAFVRRVRDAHRQGVPLTDVLETNFDADWRGDVVRTVGGQNANNSVRLTDEFMRRAQSENAEVRKWPLYNRTDGSIAEVVDAGELLHEIAYSAWVCADPGVQFHDLTNAQHTCPNNGDIVGSNPCSEYLFLNNTACNLASLNLRQFVGTDGRIDIDRLDSCVDLIVTVLDISVSMAQYPSEAFAVESLRFRTIGLGLTNLGSVFMSLGLPYGGAESCALAATLAALIDSRAAVKSAGLAEKLGAYPACERNWSHHKRVLCNHSVAANAAAITAQRYNPEWREALVLARDRYSRASARRAMRNAQLTCIAPTGTISFAMDADTTGCEPLFSHVTYKSMAEGGLMTLLSESSQDGLDTLIRQNRLRQEDRAAAEEYIKKDCGLPSSYPDDVRAVFRTASADTWGASLTPEAHLNILEALQPFVSGGISKTINLPQSATVEDVKNIYISAWKRGIKNVAVYRDGSKSSPLTSGGKSVSILDEYPASTVEDVKVGESFVPVMAVRSDLPLVRAGGYTRKCQIGNMSFYLQTGEYKDGRLGELFLSVSQAGSFLSSVLDSFSRVLSVALQHRIPVETFIQTLRYAQFEPAGLVYGHPEIRTASSLIDLIAQEIDIEYVQKPALIKRLRAQLADYAAPEDETIWLCTDLTNDSAGFAYNVQRSDESKVYGNTLDYSGCWAIVAAEIAKLSDQEILRVWRQDPQQVPDARLVFYDNKLTSENVENVGLELVVTVLRRLRAGSLKMPTAGPHLSEHTLWRKTVLLPENHMRINAYTGAPCRTCGSVLLVKTGSCWTCTQCGTTTGCG